MPTLNELITFEYRIAYDSAYSLTEKPKFSNPKYTLEKTNLESNTPLETYNGKVKYYNRYTTSFKKYRKIRIAKNKQSNCNSCK